VHHVSGKLGPQSLRARVMGELLPLEGWLNIELHCHLDAASPSGRQPKGRSPSQPHDPLPRYSDHLTV
jgi:hypothetical protein